MKKYRKENHRLNIKFIDGETNNLLFEIKDRNWMDMGDVYSDGYVDRIIKQTIEEQNLPENIIVLTVGNFYLT